jgi:hypothetical protein
MKKLILLVPVLLFFIGIQAQNDKIYPVKGFRPINNCKIIKVLNGNVVYYSKLFKNDSIPAKAIIKDGNYIKLVDDDTVTAPTLAEPNKTELYKGHDYHYYGRLYSNAITTRNTGIGLAIVGLGCTIGGVLLNQKTGGDDSAALVYLGGSLMVDVGAFLWIYGGIKAKNNLNAMTMTRLKVDVSFGPTNNGVGLALNF